MHFRFEGNSLIVSRGAGKKIYSESAFFHKLKLELIKVGFDVIKKEMAKDGHMVSEGIYYVRSRNMNKPGAFMVWDGDYQIRATYTPYNEDDGWVRLSVEKPEPEPSKPRRKVRYVAEGRSGSRGSSGGVSGSLGTMR